jgi:hypothetical protein
MKLSRDRQTVRSEKPCPSIRTPSLRSPEGEHLFSGLHQLDGSIGLVRLIIQQAENCNLIPQRNCDRFSRSSMDTLVPLQKFQITNGYPIRERIACQSAINRISPEGIEVAKGENESEGDSPQRRRGHKEGSVRLTHVEVVRPSSRRGPQPKVRPRGKRSSSQYFYCDKVRVMS